MQCHCYFLRRQFNQRNEGRTKEKKRAKACFFSLSLPLLLACFHVYFRTHRPTHQSLWPQAMPDVVFHSLTLCLSPSLYLSFFSENSRKYTHSQANFTLGTWRKEKERERGRKREPMNTPMACVQEVSQWHTGRRQVWPLMAAGSYNRDHLYSLYGQTSGSGCSSYSHTHTDAS